MSKKQNMPREPCKKCGQLHPKCTAHNRSGVACGRDPIPGGHVCNLHGGGTTLAKDAAERTLRTREIEKNVDAILAHEGVEAIADPLDELSKLAAAASAMCNALGARVNYIKELTDMDDNGRETIKAEVILYERAMDRAARMLTALVNAGFMERQVQIQEHTADAVVSVLQRIFSRLALTPEQQELVPIIVPQELRALEM